MIYVNASVPGSGHPDHGPRYKTCWVLLSAFLTFVSCGLLLSIYALAPALVGALLATWTAVALKHRATRRGRRDLLAPLWIVLAGISPALLLWALAFSPLNAR
ncbi:hypothetical protein GCM10009546_71060 [Actinomadura livida]|uniref:DUF4190 domain-containing protein n=1 Tax=Actinomadura livida TaxID=79909 RepID=A0ABP3QWS1_9ACTN|nr:hypothetical protein GCM10010208_00760 [Actinomadura livida]